MNVFLIALNVKNKTNMSSHDQTQSSNRNCEYMFLSVITSSKYVNMDLIIFYFSITPVFYILSELFVLFAVLVKHISEAEIFA